MSVEVLAQQAPTSAFKRLFTLTQRRLLAFYRDKMDVAITFAQAPLLALVFFFVFQEVITHGYTEWFQPFRSYTTANILIFIAVLTAVWFGASKAIVEIPASQVLYHQERLSFLRPLDFLLSSFIALALIALAQVILFTLTFHLLFVVIPALLHPFETGLITEKGQRLSWLEALLPLLWLKFTLVLWLTAVVAVATAMLVSVFVKTRAAATAVLTFLMIVQMLLGGSLIKTVITMNEPVRWVASLMASRWGFEAASLHFEQELNIKMPRYQQGNDHNFIETHFTASSPADALYIKLPPKKLTDWLKSLSEASISQLCQETAINKSYLESLENKKNKIPAYHLIEDCDQTGSIKEILEDEIKDLFKFLHRHDELIQPQQKLLEKLIKVESLIVLYRPFHLSQTYVHLLGLSFGFLFFTWLMFRRQ